MSVDVSVIIVSYKAADLLADCIASIEADAAASRVTVEIIVVDNDSGDGTLEHVRESWPDVVAVDAGRNGGFAAGNNIGMAAATAGRFLLLNSDARLQPGALAAMIDALDDTAGQGERRVGIVVPRLQNPDGSLQRSIRGFPTLWRVATEFFYLRRLAPGLRITNAFYGAGFDHEHSCDIEWAMGACMLVSRAVVDDVGPMNEAYFMYAEETEWQHAMRAAGWRVRFETTAHVEHIGGGTSRRNWGPMYRRQVANHVRYQACVNGPRAAARMRRMLLIALWLRATAYRLVALLPGSPDRRGALRDRARGFADARAEVASLDLDALAVRVVPEWRSPDGV